jgi:hypothetical protein
MSLLIRLKSAAPVAAVHFLVCVAIAFAVAWLVFGLWYPGELRKLTYGFELLLILMTVDVVCGPLLTMVLYDPAKSKGKWRLDFGLILLVQMTALAYGMSQVISSRPIFVAFEGDRFRIVQALDINADRLGEAPAEFQKIGFAGPQVIGVRMTKSGEADHLASIQMSINGLHPAFRPSRWQSYESQVPEVLLQLKSINELKAKNPDKLDVLNAALSELKLTESQLGYLPLVRDVTTDWVVLLDRSNGLPLAYLHLEGW